MTDLVIVPGNVRASNRAHRIYGFFGAAVTQGQTVYSDTLSDSRFKLADNNASAATSKVVGIAINAGANGQDAVLVDSDPEFTPGSSSLIPGESYFLSSSPGGICPVADVSSGMYPVFLFIAYSTTQGNLKIVRGSTPK